MCRQVASSSVGRVRVSVVRQLVGEQESWAAACHSHPKSPISLFHSKSCLSLFVWLFHSKSTTSYLFSDDIQGTRRAGSWRRTSSTLGSRLKPKAKTKPFLRIRFREFKSVLRTRFRRFKSVQFRLFYSNSTIMRHFGSLGCY